MTPKKYFAQKAELEDKIAGLRMRKAEREAMAINLRSPHWGSSVQTSHKTEATFCDPIEQAYEIGREIDKCEDLLDELQVQMDTVISTIQDDRHQTVLRYFYLHGNTWKEIANEIHYAESTIREWVSKDLKTIILPDNAIDITRNISKLSS